MVRITGPVTDGPLSSACPASGNDKARINKLISKAADFRMYMVCGPLTRLSYKKNFPLSALMVIGVCVKVKYFFNFLFQMSEFWSF